MFSPTTPSSHSPQAGDTQLPPSVNAPAPALSPHLVPASVPLSSPSFSPRQPSPPPVDLKPQLSTPQKSRTSASSLLDITPLSKGSDLETEADCAGKYDSADYVQSITQDFLNYRVFISIEDFMKNVLHVPDDWESKWKSTILKIKGDDDFDHRWRKYCDQCDDSGVSEESFYELLVEMVNTVLELAEHSESTKPQTPQRYIRNDPKKLFCGVLNEAHLSPDVATIHRDLLTYLEPSEGVSGKLTEPYLTWAHPLHVLEVKHFDNALIDGSRLPRLKAEGRDPQTRHAYRSGKSRYRRPNPPRLSEGESTSAPLDKLAPSGKRPADESLDPDRKAQKRHHKSTPGSASAGAGGSSRGGKRNPAPLPHANKPEYKNQMDVHIQVGKYLLEQFSIPAFRSHATVGLVDRDRIQFYHANHSVILASSAIDFGSGDEAGGLDKLIAILIAFSRLSLSGGGILHNLHDGKLFKDNQNLVASHHIGKKIAGIQRGKQLEFKGDEKTGPFTITLGEVISREPSLVGRSTAVLRAESSTLGGDVVVKISWPGSRRVSETDLLTEATNAANKTTDKWALKHLPRVLFHQDVVFGPDSTHGKVTGLFASPKFASDREYKYEPRTLRIIVQERLYPLQNLTNVKDIAQVLLDVACIHWWLYEVVGILHRDLSLNNIMYRIASDGKIYGVLTDFDLSSRKASLTGEYTRTSQQRTGTPPYMAYGLLTGKDSLHLYRHDVESLFYVILILATHYEIEAPTDKKNGRLRVRSGVEVLPYEDWFNQQSYKTIGFSKHHLLFEPEEFNLSPSFEPFRGWIEDLHKTFRRGTRAMKIHDPELGPVAGQNDAGGLDIPQFDAKTLGGHVCCSTLVDSARRLQGELKGLIIRYEGPAS